MPLDQDPNDTRQLEATELEYRLPEAASRPAPVPQEAPAPSRIRKGQDEVRRFWNRQVVLTVGHEQCRDHFALERTYLGYLRTSTALTTLGVVIAQLFRLRGKSSSPENFGSYSVSIPLAVVCIGMAIFVALLGAVRFYRQQHAMSRGKVHVGGWDLNLVGCITFTVIFAVFVLVLAIDIDKEAT